MARIQEKLPNSELTRIVSEMKESYPSTSQNVTFLEQKDVDASLLVTSPEYKQYPFWDESSRYDAARARMEHLNTADAHGQQRVLVVARVMSVSPLVWFIIDGNSRTTAMSYGRFFPRGGTFSVQFYEYDNLETMKAEFNKFDNDAAKDRSKDQKAYAAKELELEESHLGDALNHIFFNGDATLIKNIMGNSKKTGVPERVLFVKTYKDACAWITKNLDPISYKKRANNITGPAKEVILKTIMEEPEVAKKVWGIILSSTDACERIKEIYDNYARLSGDIKSPWKTRVKLIREHYELRKKEFADK